MAIQLQFLGNLSVFGRSVFNVPVSNASETSKEVLRCLWLSSPPKPGHGYGCRAAYENNSDNSMAGIMHQAVSVTDQIITCRVMTGA